MKKAQKALEYVAQYGGAVLVMLVVLAALQKYGVFNPKNVAVQGFAAFDEPLFRVTEYKVTGGSSTNVIMTIVNTAIDDVSILHGDIKLRDTPDAYCTPVVEDGDLMQDDDILMKRGDRGLWSWQCFTPTTMQKGTIWKTEFEMEYRSMNEQVSHTILGQLNAKIE